ncbi:MAG: hypothetical protein AAFR81_00415 [Chloroflexota bacterium]
MTAHTSSAKSTQYKRQIERLSQRIKAMQATSDKLADWRLLLAVVGGIALFVLIFMPYPVLFWLTALLTGAGFVVLIAAHRRINRHLRKFRVWRAIKRENLARLEQDWQHIPEVHIEAPLHPLEVDLDLRELHRLLNTSSSQAGARRLRQWMLTTVPHLPTIEQRQKLVAELRDHPSYRDKLTLNARQSPEQTRRQLPTGWLHDWLDSTVPMQSVDRSLGVLIVLAIASMIAVVLSQFGIISPVVSGVMWGIYAISYISRLNLMAQLGDDGQQLYDVLSRLEAVMSHMENYSYQDMPQVRKLCSPLLEAKPSSHIKRLMGTLAASSLRGNPPLWLLLNGLMPWDLYFLRRLHKQKQELAYYLPQWLDIWHELEALNSLATYADLHPEAILPSIDNETVFEVQSIGHPLIKQDERVTNDFDFAQLGNIVILTGSNMSGKSSFLRTLGTNLVMAYTGGTVLAERMQVGVFRLFTCIRVTDSLDDGISYFYAEVKRLKALLDELERDHDVPLFFAIDEIFRGTNNRERLLGSQSYINALVGKHGIGLIATHDLELTQLADGNSQVRNMHFREHIENERMVFDYTLRDGASPTTNALQIMALEGLPVDQNTLKKLNTQG